VAGVFGVEGESLDPFPTIDVPLSPLAQESLTLRLEVAQESLAGAARGEERREVPQAMTALCTSSEV
jgi:hypothetical protein